MGGAGSREVEVPLVGVTTYCAEAAWGPWRRPAALVPASYVELVAAAGGRPVLLPPFGAAPGDASAGVAEAVAALDALVVVGGGDVDPAAYGAQPHPEVSGVMAQRDRSETALLAAGLDADLPVLAICRGLQLLNVHLGGTLHQHLPDVLGHEGHQPAAGQFADVEVETVAGTVTAELLGERDTVRCSHHQGVDRLGRGLVVAARAVEATEGGAGLVEAVELPERRFVVAVQWHPEESGDRRLFDALVAAARQPRTAPAGERAR